MTETADSDDAHLLARSTAKTLKRSENCNSSAQQRCGGGGVEVVRELDGEFALDARVIGVATLGDRRFAVLLKHRALISSDHRTCALRLESALAKVALVAAESLRADTDPVADPMSRVGASANNGPNDLVADTVYGRRVSMWSELRRGKTGGRTSQGIEWVRAIRW